MMDKSRTRHGNHRALDHHHVSTSKFELDSPRRDLAGSGTDFVHGAKSHARIPFQLKDTRRSNKQPFQDMYMHRVGKRSIARNRLSTRTHRRMYQRDPVMASLPQVETHHLILYGVNHFFRREFLNSVIAPYFRSRVAR